MNNSGIFNLNRTAILAGIISASFSLHAMANAGKVEFALGGANLIRNDGSSRQISKGDEINPGDTIKTTDGRVQVRFTDGGYMSFQPNTEFKVEDYSYTGKTDGSEKAFFRLIEGGLRAITGVVGHANKPNYKVSTPVATIGIRGSEYLAEFRGSLRAHCNHGSIFVFNDKGNLILFRGQTAVVGNGAPNYGDNIEGVGARGPSDTNSAYNQETKDNYLNNLFRTGDLRNSDGSLGALGVPSAFAYASDGGEGAHYLNGPYYNETYQNFVNVDTSGNLIGITSFYTYESGSYKDVSVETFTPVPGAQTLDQGSYGALSWLRVNGTVNYAVNGIEYTYSGSGSAGVSSSPYNYGYSDTNFHFIYGTQTSVADLASLSSYQADYSFVGGTHPVDSAGNIGVLNGGSVHVDFGQQSLQGTLALTMPTGVNAGTYNGYFSGGLNTNSTGLTGGFNAGGYASGSSGGGSMSVHGFFAGSNAAQVGLSYNIYTGNTITGTAAFTQVPGSLAPSGGSSF